MESNNAFIRRAFLHACFAGELSKIREALAAGCLTVEDLDEGLKLATHMAHPDIVADLFSAGARVSTWTASSREGPTAAS